MMKFNASFHEPHNDHSKTLIGRQISGAGRKFKTTMFRSLLARPMILKFTYAVLTAAQMLGWITYARGGESSAPAAPSAIPPQTNSLPAVRRALREFDRFLDHHPLLETRLRLNSRLIANKDCLEKNPELTDFLQANPDVAVGLRIYPRYFINRALLQQANAPLSFRELAPLRDLFQEQPKLEQALLENPELIRDPAFLASQGSLRECLARHPALARVFLPQAAPLAPK